LASGFDEIAGGNAVGWERPGLVGSMSKGGEAKYSGKTPYLRVARLIRSDDSPVANVPFAST